MLLFGAGGHAKVLIEALESAGQEVTGIFDDNPNLKDLLGIPILGKYSKESFVDTPLVIAVGNNKIRKKIAEEVTHQFGYICNKSVALSKRAIIGEGTVLLGNAVVNSSAHIGKHCIINSSSVIEHDCIIADFVHIAPNATLCGHVEVGEGTLIGAGVNITPLVKIGKHCIIDAGVSITQDIPDFTRVKKAHKIELLNVK